MRKNNKKNSDSNIKIRRKYVKIVRKEWYSKKRRKNSENNVKIISEK